MRFNTNRIPTRWVLSTCLVLTLLVVSSQGAEWVQTCEADIFVVKSAGNYNAIEKVVQCMNEGEPVEDQVCLDAELEKPEAGFCAFKELPEVFFQVDPACTDLFTISDDLTTPLNTERCRLQLGELSLVITNDEQTVDSPCATVANKKKDFLSCVSLRFPDPQPSCTDLDMTKAECIVTGTAANDAAFSATTPCTSLLTSYPEDVVEECTADSSTYTYEYFCEYNGVAFGAEDTQTVQCVYTKDGTQSNAADALCEAAGQTSNPPQQCQYTNIPTARFQALSDHICQYIVDIDADVTDMDVKYCAVANGKTGDDAAINRLSVTASGELDACKTVAMTVKECVAVATTALPTCTKMNMAGAGCSTKGANTKIVPAEGALCIKAIADERIARAKWESTAIEGTCTGTPAYVDTPTCVWSTTLNNWSDESGVEHICKLGDAVYDWEFCAADKNNLGTDAPATTDCATGDYADFSDECADVFKKAAADNKVTYKADAFESACVVEGTDNVPHIVANSVCTGAGKTAGAGKTIAACTPEFADPTNLQNECTIVPDLSTTDAGCKVATYTIVDGEGKNDLTACQADATTYLNGLKTACQGDGTYKYVATCEFDGNPTTFAAQTPDVQCVYTKDTTSTNVASSFCVDAGVPAAPTQCTYDLIPAERFQPDETDDICQYIVADVINIDDYNTAFCVVADGTGHLNRLSVTDSGNFKGCTDVAKTIKECIAVATTAAPTCFAMNMAGATCATKGAESKEVPTEGALCVKATADERIARANWQNAAQSSCDGAPAYQASTSCVWSTATNDWTEASGTGQICKDGEDVYDWEFCDLDKANLGTTGPSKTPCVTAQYVKFSDECNHVFEKAATDNKVTAQTEAFPSACVVEGTDNVPHVVDGAVCTGADLTPGAGATIAACSPAFTAPSDVQNECTVVPDLSTTDAACKVATYTLVNVQGNNDFTACNADVTTYLNGLKSACQTAGAYAFEYFCRYEDVANNRDQSYQCYYTKDGQKTAADESFCSDLNIRKCKLADLPASSFVPKANAECKFLFPDGGSSPTFKYCGVYTSDTEYIGIAASAALNDACTENAKTLAECTTPIVIPNETDKCIVAPTLSCVVTGTSAAVTGDACPFINEYYTYARTEFEGCDIAELTWDSTPCDGKYDADADNFGDTKKTCMYGNTAAAVQFCEYNLAPPANEVSCTFADLTTEGARQATCAELYPVQNTGTASTTDVPMSCVIKTTAGTWVTKTFGDDAVAPAQCKNLATTTLADCAVLTFSAPAICVAANVKSAKCMVKDTEVQFQDKVPCQAALDAETIVRYTPNPQCGTYAIKPADGACYFETADAGVTYTAKKAAQHICYLTGANGYPSGVAELKFCLKPTEWDDYPDGMTKDCSNDDAGLVAGTCNYDAAIPHATCSVRLEDGSTPTLTDAQCKQFGVAACASVSVTFTGTEVECSDKTTPTPIDVTRTATCAIQLPSGGLVPLPEEDVYGYEDKCAEAIGNQGGEVSITPAKCLSAWNFDGCDGSTPIIKCMLGNTVVADAECADGPKPVGTTICPKSMSVYEWVAVQPQSCTCGTIPTTTWKCVDTGALRRELSPVDPYAIRFDYTDDRLESQPSASDDTCENQTGPKPTFNIPCPCPASTAVFVSGTGLELTVDDTDDYLKRTPNCDTGDCNIQTVFPTSESQIRGSFIRTTDNALDQKTCTHGYIDGDVDRTRKCEPSDGPFWTIAQAVVAYPPPDCSAACQVKDAEGQDLAFMHLKYVCVQDGHGMSDNSIFKLLPDSACAGIAKPVLACNRHECVASAQWVTGAWQLPASITSFSGYCDAGTDITFTRTVQCYRGGNVVQDVECSGTKPDATYTINNGDLPQCTATQPAEWYTTAWSACDATTGLVSRSIYCGRERDADALFVVDDSACPAASKPTDTSRSCCLNNGTFDVQTQKCTCATGFNGDYCEFDNRVTIQVPDFQYAEQPLKMLVTGTFTSHDNVNVDLLTKNGDFVGRITRNTVTPGKQEWSLPTVTPNARYRVRMFKSDALNVTSNDFAIVPELDCKNGGTPNYSTGRCTCTGTFSGKLCDVDLCDGCDDTCTVSNGAARNCCSSGRRFSMTEGTCVSTCTLQCSNGGFGVSKPDETPACQCACAGGWEGATCTTCPLDCSANGKRDAACETCTCNRGYSTRVEALQCQCRSLVVRLSFRRTSALPEGALHAMKADIAGLLNIDEELVTIQPNNFNSRTGRQNVDIIVSSTECATSVTLANPASWFKPADYATEFSTWSTTLQTALASSEPLPSFVGYDATLGAAIEDPGCDSTDVSANCMAKAVVGNGGPAVTDDGTESSGGSDDEDLKWIVPIAVLIPLAVIITGVVLYVKCKPQLKTTTYGSSRTDGNTAVEMTAH